MSNRNQRHSVQLRIDDLPDLAVCPRVHRSCRLVQDDDLASAEEDAGETEELTLAAREGLFVLDDAVELVGLPNERGRTVSKLEEYFYERLGNETYESSDGVRHADTAQSVPNLLVRVQVLNVEIVSHRRVPDERRLRNNAERNKQTRIGQRLGL